MNIPGRPRARLKSSSIANAELPQLPTPPNSDQATPPLTPGTQRIKSLGSISAILFESVEILARPIARQWWGDSRL